MAQLDYAAAVELLDGVKTAAVCGHINPDGDCLGSVLALTNALRSRGIETTPLLATRSCPTVYDFLAGFDDLVWAARYKGSPELFIALDVPQAVRMGDGAKVLDRAQKSIVFDHHQGPADFADVCIVDERAAAAGMLVWEFIKQAGIELTREIADCCYTALVTDTGRFQYQNADADAFCLAAELVQAGTDPAWVSQMVYQRKSLAALRLNGRVMDRTEFVCKGRAAISAAYEQDFKELGATSDDGESLIDVVRQLGGIDVAVLLREQTGIVRGSIRSKTDLDVSLVAKRLDGGGHKAASGFTVKGTMDEARAAVLDLLELLFAGELDDEEQGR